MSIEIAQLRQGGIALLTDDNLPAKIGSIEFFKEDRKIQITHEGIDCCGRLINGTLSEQAITAIESSPESILVFQITEKDVLKYEVPLNRIID